MATRRLNPRSAGCSTWRATIRVPAAAVPVATDGLRRHFLDRFAQVAVSGEQSLDELWYGS